MKDAKDRYSVNFQETSEICDFIVYKKPILVFLECKTCQDSNMRIGRLRDSQYIGLAEKHKLNGVYGYVIIWFYNQAMNETWMIPIDEIWKHKRAGKRSVTLKQLREGEIKGLAVEGKLRRKYYDYKFSDIFDRIEEQGKLPVKEWEYDITEEEGNDVGTK